MCAFDHFTILLCLKVDCDMIDNNYSITELKCYIIQVVENVEQKRKLNRV